MDLAQLYGPGYAGYLQGMQSSQNRNMQALQGMGMLSNMQTQDMQRNAMQAQLAERQRQAQQQVEAQERMQGLLSQPDDVIQGMLGMPANQVRALFTMGGPGSLSKVLEKNYEMPSDLRMINALPEGPKRTAAIEAKTGISPQFFQSDLGGQQAGFVRDPVTQQVQPVFQAEKTAAPGAVPFEMTGLTPEQARDFSMSRSRAGATQVSVDARERSRLFEWGNKLRDDLKSDNRIKAADEMSSAFKLIETAKMRPSPANDLAMATKYMKVLDPESVVRESELAMAMNASGLFDRVTNYAQMVLNGTKLTPKQREDFYGSAKAINDSFQKGATEIIGQYEDAAKRYGLDPKDVTVGRRMPDATATAPAAGTFEKLPSPSMYRGKRMKSDDGTIYRSDGMRWVKE
jgi:hypothetical protein